MTIEVLEGQVKAAIVVSLAMCVGCTGAATDRGAETGGVSDQPQAVQRVVAELATQLGVEAGELAVTAREEVTWTSAALGCPEPGKMYAQATTPGWRLTVTGPDETNRQVHAAEDGSYWVICEGGRPVKPGGR